MSFLSVNAYIHINNIQRTVSTDADFRRDLVDAKE